MKRWKTFLTYLWGGVSWGCTFFVFICLLQAWFGNEDFLQMVMHDFARQAASSVLTGIACATSAIVYTFKKISFILQVMIHFTLGLGGYFIMAAWAGWMPLEAGPALLFLAIGVLMFVGIWTGFYLYNRQEARKMNAKLQELEKTPEKFNKTDGKIKPF